MVSWKAYLVTFIVSIGREHRSVVCGMKISECRISLHLNYSGVGILYSCFSLIPPDKSLACQRQYSSADAGNHPDGGDEGGHNCTIQKGYAGQHDRYDRRCVRFNPTLFMARYSTDQENIAELERPGKEDTSSHRSRNSQCRDREEHEAATGHENDA